LLGRQGTHGRRALLRRARGLTLLSRQLTASVHWWRHLGVGSELTTLVREHGLATVRGRHSLLRRQGTHGRRALLGRARGLTLLSRQLTSSVHRWRHLGIGSELTTLVQREHGLATIALLGRHALLRRQSTHGRTTTVAALLSRKLTTTVRWRHALLSRQSTHGRTTTVAALLSRKLTTTVRGRHSLLRRQGTHGRRALLGRARGLTLLSRQLTSSVHWWRHLGIGG